MKVKWSRAMHPYGYQHHDYALSLSKFGEPQELVNSCGWLLKRSIPDSCFYDAMGCYPIFSCLNWKKLCQDLDEMKDQWIAVSIVTDPFANLRISNFKLFFKDVCMPFKEHFVIDLSLKKESYVSGHHKRYAMKALRKVELQINDHTENDLDDWVKIYSHLIRRHNIKGIQKFSPEILKKQTQIPGCVVLKTKKKGRTLGIQLWYRMQDRVYYHLGASNDEGYSCHASFAMFWEAIDYFKNQGIRWLSLGAGAGVKPRSNDGLTRFKRGWASGTRTVYFCGAVTKKEQYKALLMKKGALEDNYFPGYRKGEFL